MYSTQELLDKIKEIGNQIIDLKKQLVNYKSKYNDTLEKIKEYEIDVKYQVLVENKIEDGIILKNLEQKKIYIEKRLKEDNIYKGLKKSLKLFEQDIEMIKIEIMRLEEEYYYFVNILNFGDYDIPEEEDI